jgi:hypothetical protein
MIPAVLQSLIHLNLQQDHTTWNQLLLFGNV